MFELGIRTQAPNLGDALTGVLVALLAIVSVCFSLRYTPVTNLAIFLLAALSPYVLPAGFVAAAVAAIGRRWMWFIAAVAITSVAIASLISPWWSSTKPQTSAGNSVRIMTANLMKGQAAPLNLVGLAAQNADVLGVQELTAAAIENFRRAGIERYFPYHELDPRPETRGVGIWSRYPITRLGGENDGELSSLSARIDVPGVPGGVTFVSLRIPNPLSSSMTDWQQGIGRVRGYLQALAGRPGCVIAAGDFNSTADMSDFRALLETGFVEVRRGLDNVKTATFPSLGLLPPLFSVDHILTDGCVGEGTRTIAIPISDHRALAATVVLPR